MSAAIHPEYLENEATDEFFVRHDLAPDGQAALDWMGNLCGLSPDELEGYDRSLIWMRAGRDDEEPPSGCDPHDPFYVIVPEVDGELRYWKLRPR